MSASDPHSDGNLDRENREDDRGDRLLTMILLLSGHT
jgi:hypothetical protein